MYVFISRLLLSFYHSLQWLETEFIPYLEQWEKSVMEREGFSAKEKELMLLARETRLGITITGFYISFT